MAITAPKFALKDYITITVLILSAVGLYYRMDTKTELLKDKVERMEQKLEKVNPEALQVELDYIKRDLKSVDGKVDKILEKLEKE
jgi:septation ring formation regulator EzrA